MKTLFRSYWWIGISAIMGIFYVAYHVSLSSTQAAPKKLTTNPSQETKTPPKARAAKKEIPPCHKHKHHKAPKAAKVKLPNRSLYQVDSKWTNQDGKQLKFSSLKGKVRIIAMIYTSCKHACPVIISDIKRIEDSLPKALREKIGIVLVTIDPKRDTPKTMKAFRDKHKLSKKRWLFLHGTSDQILELAVLLGVKYKPTSKTDFAHSNLITTLDQEGRIKYRQIGLAQSPKKTVQTIRHLLHHKK